MTIFEHAMKLKQASERFYSNLAEKCTYNDGIRFILKMLSEDEQRHYTQFCKMASASPVHDEIVDFSKADTILQNLLSKEESFSCQIDQIALYQDALDIEKKNQEFFQSYYAENPNTPYKKEVEAILQTEKKHINMLMDIIELINRPNDWVENAEFNKKVEY